MFKRILLSVFCLSLFCAASAKTMTRKDFVQPVEQGKLLLVPTFVSCSVYYGSPELENVRLEFRPKGSKQPWRQALTPLYYPEFNNYRGSIVRLEEDTKYEIRFLSGGKEVCRGDVRTWKSDVPVARTVYITPEMMKNPPIKISDKGDRKGWVRYTVKPGTVLENNTDKLSILFDGAGYVLLDDIVLKAGHFRHAVEIHNSGFIRIRNCDISRWGRVGKQRFDKGGKFYEDVSTTHFGWKDGGKLPYVNFNAAIRLQRCSDVVIERCYIHDPRNHANSWRYSHPQGPCGILMDCVRYSTVIRYCDIVGSDGHWFNDCVEGIGNFEESGGFRRDADIYGNFMYFSADDNIELDGGQQNVRCFDNRFQASFCGVSIQGCAVGPSYVFGNLFFGMGDEFGECGQTIKTGNGRHGRDASAFVFNNTLAGNGTEAGIILMKTLRAFVQNNVFSGKVRICGLAFAPPSVLVNNSLKVKFADGGRFVPAKPVPSQTIPNFNAPGDINGAVQPGNEFSTTPLRPIPVVLDREFITGVKVKNGDAAPKSAAVTAQVRGKGFSSEFVIRKNDGVDWFDVTPARGVFRSGEKVAFTVKFHGEKMKQRRSYRAAFLIRLADGTSRPVTVEAETDFIPPARPHREGEFALYLDPAKPSNGETAPMVDDKNGISGRCFELNRELCKDKVFEYKFQVPKDGRYYFLLRGYGPRRSIQAAVDGGKFELSPMRTFPYMTYSMLIPGRDSGNFLRHYDLKKGEHTLRLKAFKKGLRFDTIAVTDSPGSFEPR
ncbi:MAG: right-handed parallel beta-helix repeat-containing protein [Lentisphaeria bacterium]|nr:right-handed parallel beta-helix repeat-containing protein [Lentisphaeria bacterium]